jgi:hypothetical protein
MPTAQAKLIRVPVTLNLTENEYEQIVKAVEGEAPESHKVAAFANEVLSSMAAGAMLFPAKALSQLRDINPDLDSPDAIIDAVERGEGVVNGEMVIRWPTDPALMEPLQQQAMSIGVPVEQLLKDMMDNAIAMGWFFDFSTSTRTFFFTHEEAAEIEEIVGQVVGRKGINAADILASVRLLLEVAPDHPDPESEKDETKEGSDTGEELRQILGEALKANTNGVPPEDEDDSGDEEDHLPDMTTVTVAE